MSKNKGSQYRKKPMKGQLHPKSLARNEPGHVFGPVISTNGPKIDAVYITPELTSKEFLKRMVVIGLIFCAPLLTWWAVLGGKV